MPHHNKQKKEKIFLISIIIACKHVARHSQTLNVIKWWRISGKQENRSFLFSDNNLFFLFYFIFPFVYKFSFVFVPRSFVFDFLLGIWLASKRISSFYLRYCCDYRNPNLFSVHNFILFHFNCSHDESEISEMRSKCKSIEDDNFH